MGTEAGWLQVAQEVAKLPGLLLEIYGDLAKPGVKQVGKALDTVLGLGNTVLWPIAWANERSRLALEANLEAYRCRLAPVSVEQIVAIAPEVGVPIAEKLSYVTDVHLAQMYIELLAKASQMATLHLAHPSFANVINNLSPDEAILLRTFVNDEPLPFCLVKLRKPSDNSYEIVGPACVTEEQSHQLLFPENVPAYLSNLEGLGLVNIHDDRWSTDHESQYMEMEKHLQEKFQSQYQLQLNEGRKLEVERGVVTLTQFGSKFIQACHTKG